MERIYKRVIANNIEEAIKYVKNGYAPWLIDCSNIENFVDKNTIIMSILNGISSEEILAQKYNWENIPLAFFLGHSETIAPNNYFYDNRGTVIFGAKENFTNPNIISIIEKYFTQVKINYQIPEDINYAYWLKFMLNISTNQRIVFFCLPFLFRKRKVRSNHQNKF